MTDPESRFWAKVDKDGPVPSHRPELGPCWTWTAYVTDRGYGMFKLLGKVYKAHRVAYEFMVGPIPEGVEPDHLCRVRNCVNPSHLELVSHAENCRRARMALDDDEIERLWRLGYGKRAIGEMLGCSWGPIRRVALERGLEPHRTGNPGKRVAA